MAITQVVCPKCQHSFSPDEAISHEIEKHLEDKFNKNLETQRDQDRKAMLAWQEKQKQILEEKEQSTRKELETKVKKELLEKSDEEAKQLREELEAKTKQLGEAREQELKLRLERNKLEDEKKSFELDKQRQLDEEREKIRQKTEEEITEKMHFKEKEKDQIIDSLKKSLEDAQRKANQGSQQLQGEILEIELEEFLKKEFPLDSIVPVPKGINGADVMQQIHDQLGRQVGTIIWESKRTKNWTEEWVQKLKDDMRSAKADVAIIVSSVLPQGIKYFGPREGVYVTSFDCLFSVATLIRQYVIREYQTKNSVVGKNEKMEVLYNYLSSNQFIQKIEGIVEAFGTMKTDLDKEKRQLTQIWAKREKQIERVITNTLGMHGDLQGLMGASLPDLKTLEISTVETFETFDSTSIYRKETTVTSEISDPTQELLLDNIDKV